MLIHYFSRNYLCGYSISRVFAPIIEQLSNEHQVFSYNVPSHRADPISIVRNLWFVFKKRNRRGINHITGDIHYCIFALVGCNSVLTIHDLGFINDNSSSKSQNFWYLLYRRIFWIYLPCIIADKITCISPESARILKSYLNERQHKKIIIIANPVDSKFVFREKAIINAKPVILHIGTTPNKNLERVILALRYVYCSLHIVGRLTEYHEKLLQDCHIEFRNEIDLSDGEIVDRYKDCDILSFPSTYEGFGMPIIEAQATGRAVVTSIIEPMKTVAGMGAILVDPFSIDSIREGFLSLINNPKLICQSTNAGILNVKRFDKGYICEEYYKVYDSMSKHY
jgi:glycosyltransferase involved in cell wall biosynthesis